MGGKCDVNDKANVMTMKRTLFWSKLLTVWGLWAQISSCHINSSWMCQKCILIHSKKGGGLPVGNLLLRKKTSFFFSVFSKNIVLWIYFFLENCFSCRAQKYKKKYAFGAKIGQILTHPIVRTKNLLGNTTWVLTVNCKILKNNICGSRFGLGCGILAWTWPRTSHAKKFGGRDKVEFYKVDKCSWHDNLGWNQRLHFRSKFTFVN